MDTKDKITYIVGNVIWMVITMIWYRNLMFRCIPDFTYTESKIILWGIVIGSVAIGYLFAIRREYNGWDIAVNFLPAYGIYTVFTYYEYRRMFIYVMLSVVAILTVWMCICVFRKPIRKKNKSAGILRKIYVCCQGTRIMLSTGMFALISSLALGAVFDFSLIESSVEAMKGIEAEEQTIAANIDTVVLLQDEKWNTLSIQERLDVLQTIANIEARYLGLPNELNVEAGSLEESTLGSYDETTNRIIINIDSLEYCSGYEMLDTVCHEAYHSYQYKLVAVYENTEESYKNLRGFGIVKNYAEEFNNYADGTENFDEYYTQYCESDAREYAQEAVQDYCSRIDEYLAGQ